MREAANVHKIIRPRRRQFQQRRQIQLDRFAPMGPNSIEPSKLSGGVYFTTRTLCGSSFANSMARSTASSIKPELIDQPQIQRLLGGEHLPGGRGFPIRFVVGQLRPRFAHNFLELIEGLIDQRLQNLMFLLRHLRRELPRRAAHRFERAADDRIVLNLPFLQQVGDRVMRNDDANRTGPCGAFRENGVGHVAGGHRQIVAAAGRDAAHAHHERNFSAGALAFAEHFQMVIQIIAAGDGAAGGIDAHHHGFDIWVEPGMLDLPFGKTIVVHDRPFNGDDGHLVFRFQRMRKIFFFKCGSRCRYD